MSGEDERDATALAAWRRHGGFVPAGHYYSPIPSLDEIRGDQERIFGPRLPELPGIDLVEDEQLALVAELAPYHDEIPFSAAPGGATRYSYQNDMYSYSDAVFLYALLRHLQPRRFVEVGSGHSTCLVLDVAERWLDPSFELTCVEPHPEALRSLWREGDAAKVRLIERSVQQVPMEVFTALTAGDMLFVDSTHTVKTGGDVNHLVFEVLPRLAPGVVVHFHDILYPFEYPPVWVYQGRAWNETYLLRAFLQYNDSFRILVWNSFLEHIHRGWLARHLPLCLENPGGGLWLRHVPA